MAITRSASPSPEVVAFLRSLAPGSVVAQLDDGTLVVCGDVEEAEQRFAKQSRPAEAVAKPAARTPDAYNRGWSRVAAVLDN